MHSMIIVFLNKCAKNRSLKDSAYERGDEHNECKNTITLNTISNNMCIILSMIENRPYTFMEYNGKINDGLLIMGTYVYNVRVHNIIH